MVRSQLTVEPGLGGREQSKILSPPALDFLWELHERFDTRRRELMAARESRLPPVTFPSETRSIREDETWSVAPPRIDYADRRVEITGPTDRKMVINALNSGAKGFMADFEDANSPTWRNLIEGQANLVDAVEGTIEHESPDGRRYRLGKDPATLLVRPRGWHLPEEHLRRGEAAVSGALVDFGLFAFHCSHQLHSRGTGVYLYIPKLEHYLEARLWNDVLTFSEQALDLPSGTFRATVLIETLPAVFQMDEILFELREHSYGLNAGRWDYIFSMIKSFRHDPRFILPDRDDVTMTVPFMRSYTDLLVKSCHRRSTFAMGGMAALIPSRKDPIANRRALDAVREDKEREAQAGFDGTWVAHPDVVAVAMSAFDDALRDEPNQIHHRRDDVFVTEENLLDVDVSAGRITEAGLRTNIDVGFRYISFWLNGRGAAAINNMMEDAATAEISRSQLWQWIYHRARLEDGRRITRKLVNEILREEMDSIRHEVGEETWSRGQPGRTRQIFERVALSDDFPAFFTLVAYPFLADHDARD